MREQYNLLKQITDLVVMQLLCQTKIAGLQQELIGLNELVNTNNIKMQQDLLDLSFSEENKKYFSELYAKQKDLTKVKIPQVEKSIAEEVESLSKLEVACNEKIANFVVTNPDVSSEQLIEILESNKSFIKNDLAPCIDLSIYQDSYFLHVFSDYSEFTLGAVKRFNSSYLSDDGYDTESSDSLLKSELAKLDKLTLGEVKADSYEEAITDDNDPVVVTSNGSMQATHDAVFKLKSPIIGDVFFARRLPGAQEFFEYWHQSNFVKAYKMTDVSRSQREPLSRNGRFSLAGVEEFEKYWQNGDSCSAYAMTLPRDNRKRELEIVTEQNIYLAKYQELEKLVFWLTDYYIETEYEEVIKAKDSKVNELINEIYNEISTDLSFEHYQVAENSEEMLDKLLAIIHFYQEEGQGIIFIFKLESLLSGLKISGYSFRAYIDEISKVIDDLVEIKRPTIAGEIATQYINLVFSYCCCVIRQDKFEEDLLVIASTLARRIYPQISLDKFPVMQQEVIKLLNETFALIQSVSFSDLSVGDYIGVLDKEFKFAKESEIFKVTEFNDANEIIKNRRYTELLSDLLSDNNWEQLAQILTIKGMDILEFWYRDEITGLGKLLKQKSHDKTDDLFGCEFEYNKKCREVAREIVGYLNRDAICIITELSNAKVMAELEQAHKAKKLEVLEVHAREIKSAVDAFLSKGCTISRDQLYQAICQIVANVLSQYQEFDWRKDEFCFYDLAKDYIQTIASNIIELCRNKREQSLAGQYVRDTVDDLLESFVISNIDELLLGIDLKKYRESQFSSFIPVSVGDSENIQRFETLLKCLEIIPMQFIYRLDMEADEDFAFVLDNTVSNIAEDYPNLICNRELTANQMLVTIIQEVSNLSGKAISADLLDDINYILETVVVLYQGFIKEYEESYQKIYGKVTADQRSLDLGEGSGSLSSGFSFSFSS